MGGKGNLRFVSWLADVLCMLCMLRSRMDVERPRGRKEEMERVRNTTWDLERARKEGKDDEVVALALRLSLYAEAEALRGPGQEMCTRMARMKCLEALERKGRDVAERRESNGSTEASGRKLGANVQCLSLEQVFAEESIKKLLERPATPTMTFGYRSNHPKTSQKDGLEGEKNGGNAHKRKLPIKRGPAPAQLQSGPDLSHERMARKQWAATKTETCADAEPMHVEEPQKAGDDPPAATGGFVTARTKLIAEHKKNGNKAAAAELESIGKMASDMFPAGPKHGPLRRDKQRGGKPVQSGAGRGGFVPPFMKKAMDSAGGGEEEEGPISKKHMDMLADESGELPEPLCNMDPKIVEQVCNEIMDNTSRTSWDDIAGQNEAKQLIKELVVWPMMNTELFRGARAPPKGLLLFGPPGTGKTLIGKAVAGNINATFFNISASSLTSKWIGEGEKMVRALFAVAGRLQPSVIFIDEIDSLLSARKAEGEHEASRRLKTEFLVQMEGCDSSSADRRVLLIGATNRPEELDEAARRRMPKQLYVPLPCDAARKQMVLRTLREVKSSLSEEDLDKLVRKTDGYSGSDMRNLIQEACQGPVRDIMSLKGETAVVGLTDQDLRAVVLKDFQKAARAQRASVSPEEIQRYELYNQKHGASYLVDGSSEDMDDDW